MIESAADGVGSARSRFAARYAPRIRKAIARRWKNGPLSHTVDDAVQDVFFECLKDDGVLHKADRRDPAGFRALLGSVVRNVILRHESRHARDLRREPPLAAVPAEPSTSVSRAVDREWAQAITAAAAEEHRRWAAKTGEAAVRRLEILRLRFVDGLCIRNIAARWQLEPRYVHHQYAKARRDFRSALLRVLKQRLPHASDGELEEQCRQLTDLLR